MVNDDITLKEIERVVAQAPSRKSCEPDNIYADLKKKSQTFLDYNITLLSIKCLSKGVAAQSNYITNT